MQEEQKTAPYLQNILAKKVDVNLDAPLKTYSNDDEIKRIRKARKQKRIDTYEPTEDNLKLVWAEFERILKEAKLHHQEALKI